MQGLEYIAPNADSVRVSLGPWWQGRNKTNQSRIVVILLALPQGQWMKDFTIIRVNIDGAKFNDPGTGFFYGSQRWESGIEIPAKDQDFYALKNVPHGNMQQIIFPSKSTNIHKWHLFILPRVMKKAKPNIRYCTCNMDGVKMKLHGVFRARPT